LDRPFVFVETNGVIRHHGPWTTRRTRIALAALLPAAVCAVCAAQQAPNTPVTGDAPSGSGHEIRSAAKPSSGDEIRGAATPGSSDEDGGEETAYVAPTSRDRIGRIMVPVYINQNGPYRFVIDTGASRSVVAPHVAVALGLQPDPNRLLELRGVTGAEVVPSVFVHELKAGELVLSKQVLPVVTPSVFADADGILGVDGFDSMCLSANFVRRSVRILRNGCPRISSDWARARGSFRFGGLLIVKARMRGPSRVQAIIDSGAERSLGNLPLLKALKLEQKALDPASATNVFGATSHRVTGSLLPTPTMYLGDLEVADLMVTFGDFDVFRLWNLENEPAIVIGMDVLGTVDALMVDYRRGELRVLPRGADDAPPELRPTLPGRIPNY
jgi:hypothetical protein